MWELMMFGLGLVGLWVGTEFVIPATVTLGHQRGISPAVLGLTVLAIGTDLPELLVAIDGGLQQLRGVDASGVVVGNAIGSALTQCTLVLGIATWVRSDSFSPHLAARDFIALIVAFALLVAFSADGHVGGWEGLVLVAIYGGYLSLVIRHRKDEAKIEVPPEGGGTRTLLAIGGGLLVILISAELVVANGMLLAETWGVGQGLIGVLLIAAGTSLPELVLSFGAAIRGQTTLSVANLVGSNVFDLLVPIGASALIYPLTVGRETLLIDLPATAVAHLVAFGLLRSGWRRQWVATSLVGLYAVFASVRIAMGS
jgi:cation:H+ antiporter